MMGYVPTLYAMLIARKPIHEMVDYLLWLEGEHMGLKVDRQRSQYIAEKLFGLV